MTRALCLDYGSTFTKAALVDTDDGSLIATRVHPTTIATDVLDGYHAITKSLAAERIDEVFACSSAGGGLRLAVVGYERAVTAEAGYRVGLSAGARVVHVASGPLSRNNIDELIVARPDVVLLVGGTDGGNAEVLCHNARRLGIGRVSAPVVLAGNSAAAADAQAELASRGRRVILAANVLPRIGMLVPGSARAAIRGVFIDHVIGGKGLSRGRQFSQMVRAATPDAVLAGVSVLAEGAGGIGGVGDILVIDIGGATTDVYSALTPDGEDATLRRDVVATLWHARTVEGDLGMRWNATGVVQAARAERLPVADALVDYAQQVQDDPGYLPSKAGGSAGLVSTDAVGDVRLAELAVTVAVRRHGRPTTESAESAGLSGEAADPAARAAAGSVAPRPLRDVAWVVGSGGVLRYHDDQARAQILGPARTDRGGGWRVPTKARIAVDEKYVLFAAGLLAEVAPSAAAALATRSLHEVRD